MRVLYDHQILDAQVRGGASRYFYELVSALRSRDLAVLRLPPIYTDNEYFGPLLAELDRTRDGVRSLLIERLRRLGYTNLATREIERAWRRARSRLNRRASAEELAKQDFDLFHPTYYDPYFLGPLQGKPFVLTIHDMIHEIYPEYFRAGDRTREHKELLARAAARIIAPSACTKADIVKYLGIDPAKIEVIYHACHLMGEHESVPVPDRFVLYVGGRGRYKNFKLFFLAFARLAAALPDLHLVCAGQSAFDPAERELIAEHGLTGRCLRLPASDRQLTFLYRKASLFVYPSLYEGFGLPILEAFACGCPVALSETSCFPEVAGDAAVYFDPTSPLAIAGAMERVLLDGEARRRLIRRGQARLERFSWAATAERTACVYAECRRAG
jgi:glycosyltransferase involved in cell wall biosynthesis